MRKSTKFCVLFLFFTWFLSAQPKWDLIHPDNQNLWAQKIFFINFNTGWAYGTYNVYRTTNSGYNWENLTPSQPGSYNNLFFVNVNTGWISAGKNILKTTNGGINWALQDIPYPTATLIWNINSIYFLNESTGYLTTNYEQDVGQSYYGYNFIAKTINGGINWIQIYDGDQFHENSVSIKSLLFFDENKGYGLLNTFHPGHGSSSFVLRKTTDGGLNWSYTSSPYNLNHSPKAQYLTKDTFFHYSNFHNSPLFRSLIRRSDDEGQTWQEIFNSSDNQNDFHFINNNIAFLAGEDGTLTWTSNGGQDWNQQQLNTQYDLYSIFFLNKDTAWVLSAFGGVFRTTNASTVNITPISSKIPNSFSLKQNYPNPFNPSTKIRFDIPVNSKQVRLTVYNSIGQEVAVLVDEQLQPGEYEYDFNAPSYPSGVYFYKLMAGEFSQIKKMILVK